MGGLIAGRRRGGSSADSDRRVSSSGSGNHSHSVSLSDTFQSSVSRDKSQRVRTPPAVKHAAQLLAEAHIQRVGWEIKQFCLLLRKNGKLGDKTSYFNSTAAVPVISIGIKNTYMLCILCSLPVWSLLLSIQQAVSMEGQFIYSLPNSSTPEFCNSGTGMHRWSNTDLCSFVQKGTFV